MFDVMPGTTHRTRRRPGLITYSWAVTPVTPVTSYLVCTNPRSGSWLLSDGLAATSVAGNPREWFNVAEEHQQTMHWRGQYFAPSCERYLRHVLTLGTTSNGIFAVKFHYYQFADLAGRMAKLDHFRGLSVPERISAAFRCPKYIWLLRTDKARQAISYYRAYSSGGWWLLDAPTMASRGNHRREPAFDPLAIGEIERTLLQNEMRWRSYFAAAGVEPLVVTYEELSGAYVTVLRRVLEWLGVPAAGEIPIRAPRLMRQADGKTEEWLARYLEIKGKHDDANFMLTDDGTKDQPTPSMRTAAASKSSAVPVSSPLFVHTRRYREDASARHERSRSHAAAGPAGVADVVTQRAADRRKHIRQPRALSLPWRAAGPIRACKSADRLAGIVRPAARMIPTQHRHLVSNTMK
jgi:trehalose 2-sulfotransferase